MRFRYGLSPVRINGASRVESTTFTSAVSGDHFDLPADLMILALGSAATPLAGVPFHVAAMRVPSNSSRVLDGGRPVEGLYCAGWVKRGPSGGLGSNKFDALDTADAILRDYRAGRLRSVISDAGALQDLLDKRAPRWLGYDGWKRIDAWERLEGQDKGLSARSKLHALDALVAVGSAPKDSEVERNP